MLGLLRLALRVEDTRPIPDAAPVSSEKAKAVRRSMLRSLSVYATRGGSPAILRTAASSESANITASQSWK